MMKRLNKSVDPYQYKGLSYEQASRLAMELTREAVETGRTIRLSEHLTALWRGCVPGATPANDATRPVSIVP